ncbi:MAG: hypothetical protein JWO71_2769 [Candidatus Acidoferrum typicum]|nr:hypothetical protein [Candidatus Acidoferrum typicum]
MRNQSNTCSVSNRRPNRIECPVICRIELPLILRRQGVWRPKLLYYQELQDWPKSQTVPTGTQSQSPSAVQPHKQMPKHT